MRYALPCQIFLAQDRMTLADCSQHLTFAGDFLCKSLNAALWAEAETCTVMHSKITSISIKITNPSQMSLTMPS